MRAIQVEAPFGLDAIQIVERPDPTPGPGEVRVRIRAAGLCHSDLSAINGDRPWPLQRILVGFQGGSPAASAKKEATGKGGSGLPPARPTPRTREGFRYPHERCFRRDPANL